MRSKSATVSKSGKVKGKVRPKGKGCNAQRKGTVGERQAAAYLSQLGFKAERACQLGVKDGRDVICESLPNVFLEVKRDESVRPWTAAMEKAMRQAEEKCRAYSPDGRAHPAVLFRRNGEPWGLAIRIDLNANVDSHSQTIAFFYGDAAIAQVLRTLNGSIVGGYFGLLLQFDPNAPDGVASPSGHSPEPAPGTQAVNPSDGPGENRMAVT